MNPGLPLHSMGFWRVWVVFLTDCHFFSFLTTGQSFCSQKEKVCATAGIVLFSFPPLRPYYWVSRIQKWKLIVHLYVLKYKNGSQNLNPQNNTSKPVPDRSGTPPTLRKLNMNCIITSWYRMYLWKVTVHKEEILVF